MISSTPAMQVFTQKSNPQTGVSEWDVQAEDYDFHQEIARSAFADMLHDTERNQKYYVALKKAIDKMHSQGKKANVLDIGTGTGLLSIMAARCGADSIVACEAFQPMAECALQIIKENNAADKIKLIPKRSTDIKIPDDMEERANILVTEVFDTELIGEGAIGTFSHAHKCLLESDCIVVPDSAVIYAQVVECPSLNKWNKINDLADEDLKILLKTPEKIKLCPGSASVHDIQLSQLPREEFRPLSEPIPVLYYDWSGRTPLDKSRVVRQNFTPVDSGVAQMVFVWWDLNMDDDGTIISCAPWWTHTDADMTAPHPQDTIPWRDHWMQAVYYFPATVTTTRDREYTLISCQDEYSLWFHIAESLDAQINPQRPICVCSVHVMFSRTHVSYLNDGRRTKKYLSEIRDTINTDSTVLNLNSGSLLGLAAATMGAKKVYYVEDNKFVLDILKEYIDTNELKNVEIVSEMTDEYLSEVTHVISDPNFTSSILPWDNLRAAHMLYKWNKKMTKCVSVVPKKCSFWAVPVKFLDLQKIRIPLSSCEGIDMKIFDNLIERSRQISDAKLEAQPLWEYPCVCWGTPREVLSLDLTDIRSGYSDEQSVNVSDSVGAAREVNAVAVWAEWGVRGADAGEGERVRWDRHVRQAVYILEKSRTLSPSDKWSYKVVYDVEKGTFSMEINI